MQERRNSMNSEMNTSQKSYIKHQHHRAKNWIQNSARKFTKKY